MRDLIGLSLFASLCNCVCSSNGMQDHPGTLNRRSSHHGGACEGENGQNSVA